MTKAQLERDIDMPSPYDVLSGRGKGVLKHPGNQRWKEMIKERQMEYLALHKNEKMYLTAQIVNEVRHRLGGRFLQKNTLTGKWFEIGNEKANEKTAQALREGAPKLRRTSKQQKHTPATTASRRSTPMRQITPTKKNPVELQKIAPLIHTSNFPTTPMISDEHFRGIIGSNDSFMPPRSPTSTSSTTDHPHWIEQDCFIATATHTAAIFDEDNDDTEPLPCYCNNSNEDLICSLDEQSVQCLASCLGMPSLMSPSSSSNSNDDVPIRCCGSITPTPPPCSSYSYSNTAGPPPLSSPPINPHTNTNTTGFGVGGMINVIVEPNINITTSAISPQKVHSTALAGLLEKQRMIFATFVANDDDDDDSYDE